jgi:hypothetical protein
MKIKLSILLLVLIAAFPAGCESRQKEEALQKKEQELNQREQQLLLKEKTLAIREAEVLRKEKLLDSTSYIDSTISYNPVLIGKWTVKMTCTETTCTGSAVGDVNTQEWNFSYQGNTVIAKVMEGNQLVRTYTGTYKNNAVEMTDGLQSTTTQPAVKMMVRLRIINTTSMDGQREIIRDNNCKIIYALELQKQS